VKPRVYIETSVISYLTGRPSRDMVIAAHQQITREWWQTQASSFEPVVSELVRREAAVTLAEQMVTHGAVPKPERFSR
jgi:hypothetical protein